MDEAIVTIIALAASLTAQTISQQTGFAGFSLSTLGGLVVVIGLTVLVVLVAILRWLPNILRVDASSQGLRNTEMVAQINQLKGQHELFSSMLVDAEGRYREEQRKRQDSEAKISSLQQEIAFLRKQLEEKQLITPQSKSESQQVDVLGVWPSAPGLDPKGNARALSLAGVKYNALSGEKATMEDILYELPRGTYNTIEVGGRGNADAIELADGMATSEFWAQVCNIYHIRLFLALADNSTGTRQLSIADAVYEVPSIHAVISVQGEVPDEVARRFARMLYAKLGRGSTLAAAQLEAGLAVMEHKNLFVLREKS